MSVTSAPPPASSGHLRQTLATLPRDTRDTLFMLGVIAWVIAPQVGRLPWWASALAASFLFWRGILSWRGQALPNRWLLLGVVVIAVGATLITYRTILGRDAGVTLIVLLLTLKTLELRARRDALVVFFLGFFTMLSNFFFSQSLLTAVAMLVALMGLLTALVNAHMPVGRPPLLLPLRTAGMMAVLGAPIMLALFVFFPRMAPLWGMPSDALSGRSGLSGTMEIGHVAKLALDDSVVMRIRFDTPGHVAPPASQLYFRGPVLSEFDGWQWRAPTLRQDPWLGQWSLLTQMRVQGEPIRYTVTLEPHQRPWLMVLEAATEKPALNGANPFMTPDLQWLSTRPITDVVRYSAESYPDFQHGPTRMTDALRDLALLPASSNPRTVALAQTLQADPAIAQGGTQALVDAVLHRLRTGGYEYTLEPGLYGQHSADEFWFDRKVGFCEHIASSFVILLRAAGVPARIVTGYQGGESNNVDGYWTVRQSDAHAWAEVWMEQRGWVRVDPTGAVAPGRIGQFQRLTAPRGVFGEAMGTVISPGMVQQLRAVWEAMNNHWNQWVLNYTQSRQLDLLKALGFTAPSWQDLARVLGGLLGVAALLGAAWTLWERRQHDPWLRLLARTRQRLAQAGLVLPDSTPPRTIATQVQAQFGDSAHALCAWLLELEQLRYAPSPAASGQLRQLQRRWHSLPWPAPRSS
ncbi:MULTISPECIES: transglutaminase TgpA family protein [Giesbergeria]|uniref:DUF3488 and DUF4129 domain-containing transglutaminase family protein n=1 Tax=Giesbergeria sinuosa TaxID=80883 RepID=A0ABV9QGU5_9BURK